MDAGQKAREEVVIQQLREQVQAEYVRRIGRACRGFYRDHDVDRWLRRAKHAAVARDTLLDLIAKMGRGNPDGS